MYQTSNNGRNASQYGHWIDHFTGKYLFKKWVSNRENICGVSGILSQAFWFISSQRFSWNNSVNLLNYAQSIHMLSGCHFNVCIAFFTMFGHSIYFSIFPFFFVKKNVEIVFDTIVGIANAKLFIVFQCSTACMRIENLESRKSHALNKHFDEIQIESKWIWVFIGC